MTYNRFCLLLKNWHVAHNNDARSNDRLHKIAKLYKTVYC